jgi:hypothetical protein
MVICSLSQATFSLSERLAVEKLRTISCGSEEHASLMECGGGVWQRSRFRFVGAWQMSNYLDEILGIVNEVSALLTCLAWTFL